MFVVNEYTLEADQYIRKLTIIGESKDDRFLYAWVQAFNVTSRSNQLLLCKINPLVPSKLEPHELSNCPRPPTDGFYVRDNLSAVDSANEDQILAAINHISPDDDDHPRWRNCYPSVCKSELWLLTPDPPSDKALVEAFDFDHPNINMASDPMQLIKAGLGWVLCHQRLSQFTVYKVVFDRESSVAHLEVVFRWHLKDSWRWSPVETSAGGDNVAILNVYDDAATIYHLNLVTLTVTLLSPKHCVFDAVKSVPETHVVNYPDGDGGFVVFDYTHSHIHSIQFCPVGKLYEKKMWALSESCQLQMLKFVRRVSLHDKITIKVHQTRSGRLISCDKLTENLHGDPKLLIGSASDGPLALSDYATKAIQQACGKQTTEVDSHACAYCRSNAGQARFRYCTGGLAESAVRQLTGYRGDTPLY